MSCTQEWFPIYILLSFRFADKICLNLVISFFFWPWLIVWLCLVCIILIYLYIHIQCTFPFYKLQFSMIQAVVSNVFMYLRLFIYINWSFYYIFSVFLKHRVGDLVPLYGDTEQLMWRNIQSYNHIKWLILTLLRIIKNSHWVFLLTFLWSFERA